MKYFVSLKYKRIDKFLWSLRKAGTMDGMYLITFMESFKENHIQFSNKLFIRSLLLLTENQGKQRIRNIYNTIGTINFNLISL